MNFALSLETSANRLCNKMPQTLCALDWKTWEHFLQRRGDVKLEDFLILEIVPSAAGWCSIPRRPAFVTAQFRVKRCPVTASLGSEPAFDQFDPVHMPVRSLHVCQGRERGAHRTSDAVRGLDPSDREVGLEGSLPDVGEV